MLYDSIVDCGQKGYELDSKTRLKNIKKKYRNGQKVKEQESFKQL